MIYTVTTIYFKEGVNVFNVDTRCWGYFLSLDEAKKVVINNVTNLNENGYWPYVIIEEMEEGFHNYSEIQYWYKYNKKTNKYCKIKQPSKARGIVNWALG